jgi:hypothetical protein
MLSVIYGVNYADCRNKAHYSEYCYAECCYAECCYAECLSTMLNFEMLSVAFFIVVLSVVRPIVTMLNVIAP